MLDLICDTSPIQYLHQLELLYVIPALGEQVFIPPKVVDEIEVGRSLGVSLPDISHLDWVTIQQPLYEVVLRLAGENT